MAERRMFAKSITDADAFTNMPSTAQALYFHLNQGADDDGFNNQINHAMANAHASADDLMLLLVKNFLIRFDSGVIVIKHWRIHNTIRQDRYKPTNFQEELAMLGIKENKAYTTSGNQVATTWQPSDNQMETQDSIDKDSINYIVSKDTPSSPGAEDEFEVDEDEELNSLLQSVVKKHEPSVLTKTQKDRFEKFWNLYPKKQNRKEAEKAWKKIDPSPEETNSILCGLQRSIEKDSRFREKQFTPLPATWLNAGGWEDEFADEEPKPRAKNKPMENPGDTYGSFDADEFLQAATRRRKK